jgi:chemotaxis protein CheD
MDNDNVVKVGMAELSALKHPGVLITLGLGSCVGIALYDRVSKVIGLAHVMLPSSLQIKNNDNNAKFADTAIVQLLDEMIKLGASRRNIVAKLAGGAQMFAFNSSLDIMKVGERNTIAAKKKLRELNISIISEDIGGNYGRTIELFSTDGRLVIKTLGFGIKKI